MPKELKLKSHDLLVGPGRAPARAMLKAVGFTDEDLSKPIVGVANTWIEVMPCNFHLRRLSERVFQAKFAQAGLDSTRFLVNSTVGMAGFIDIGSRIGLDQHDEDFGQTLGYWGVASGPYLMLPLLGPSTVRDAAGKVPDYYLYSPYEEVDSEGDRYALYALDVVDTRARLLEAEKLVAADRYTFFREAYLQRRDYLVKDGVMDDEFLEEDELFEDE